MKLFPCRMKAAIPSAVSPWSEFWVTLIVANRCLTRACFVLKTHLAQLTGTSLRLGDRKRDGSHPFYRPFFIFGSALLCVHKSFFILS
jgi:hypothetical protein